MTQVTDRSLPLSSAQARSSVLATCLLRGAIAAGLGLGALAVLVMMLWICSPYPDNGLGGALRTAASLWLLAHGAQLVRPATLSGTPAPVGLVPLLVMVVPIWLAHRAARDVRLPDDDEAYEDGGLGPLPCARTVFWGVTGGYLAIAFAAVLYAATGPLPAAPLGALLHLPLTVALAVGAGVWTAHGRPLGPLPDHVPAWVRRMLLAARTSVAARAAGAATAALLGGGALLAGAGLVWHLGVAQDAFLRLAEDTSGRCALLMLGVALVPNAAVWGASYGLGPGFAVGTGAVASPLGVVGAPALPHFPLLAAVPTGGHGSWWNWAAVGVPLAAGLVLAGFTSRVAAAEGWGRRETARAALLGAVLCGCAFALLAAVAGGPLGTGALAALGPVWWRTGGAALLWAAGVGVPGAVILRGCRRWVSAERRTVRDRMAGVLPRLSRRRKAVAASVPQGGGTDYDYDFTPVDGAGLWHEDGAREARWAALKEASGGLMADTSLAGGGAPSSPPRPLPNPGATSDPAPRTPEGPGGGAGSVSGADAELRRYLGLPVDPLRGPGDRGPAPGLTPRLPEGLGADAASAPESDPGPRPDRALPADPARGLGTWGPAPGSGPRLPEGLNAHAGSAPGNGPGLPLDLPLPMNPAPRPAGLPPRTGFDAGSAAGVDAELRRYLGLPVDPGPEPGTWGPASRTPEGRDLGAGPVPGGPLADPTPKPGPVRDTDSPGSDHTGTE
ncbi:cell division protein PerM [Streptomyces violascens]|uniref:cell division protein PerM n=1 Tax=Streptomyces violascens TaxID=67381 RepID=UPI0036A8F887